MTGFRVLSAPELIHESKTALIAYARRENISITEALRREDLIDQHWIRVRHRALRILERITPSDQPLPYHTLIDLERRLLEVDPFPFPLIQSIGPTPKGTPPTPIETAYISPPPTALDLHPPTKPVSVGVGVSVGVARARALGATGPDQRITCLIPGHHHHAILRPASYRCDELGSMTLAHLRARIAYARRNIPTPAFSRLELARWGERLDHEAGILNRRPIPIFNIDSPVARGIELLLGLRDPQRWTAADPFTFARCFGMAWCDACDDYIKQGMRELRQRGLIRRVGNRGRVAIWAVAHDPC